MILASSLFSTVPLLSWQAVAEQVLGLRGFIGFIGFFGFLGFRVPLQVPACDHTFNIEHLCRSAGSSRAMPRPDESWHSSRNKDVQ